MAKNFMSSVLDELMGRNRDALPTEEPKQPNWDDPEVNPKIIYYFWMYSRSEESKKPPPQ